MDPSSHQGFTNEAPAPSLGGGGAGTDYSRGDSALSAFLASSDSPCPHCNYNLRGLTTNHCPECNTPIRLSIASTRPARSAIALLLLAFGWVFAAGAMNGYRNLTYALSEATVYSTAQSFISYSITSSASPGAVTVTTPRGTTTPQSLRFSTSGSVTINGNTITQGLPARTAARSNWTAIGGPAGVNISPTTPPPAAATYNWSAVSPNTWYNLAWWSTLALLAATGLLTLAAKKLLASQAASTRPPVPAVAPSPALGGGGGDVGVLADREGRSRSRSDSSLSFSPLFLRRMTRFALSLFALYAGYHFLMFTRDFTGL